MDTIVTVSPETKNSILFDRFVESLGDISTWPNDLPRDDNNNIDKKQITSAISNAKQKLKKAAKKSLL